MTHWLACSLTRHPREPERVPGLCTQLLCRHLHRCNVGYEGETRGGAWRLGCPTCLEAARVASCRRRHYNYRGKSIQVLAMGVEGLARMLPGDREPQVGESESLEAPGLLQWSSGACWSWRQGWAAVRSQGLTDCLRGQALERAGHKPAPTPGPRHRDQAALL